MTMTDYIRNLHLMIIVMKKIYQYEKREYKCYILKVSQVITD
jgi:hypothetical protein